MSFLFETLIDSSMKVNTIENSFMGKLDLCICKTIVDAQKIDGSRREIYGIVIALFQMDDKEGKSCFFKKTILLADISIDISFKMIYFILSNV